MNSQKSLLPICPERTKNPQNLKDSGDFKWYTAHIQIRTRNRAGAGGGDGGEWDFYRTCSIYVEENFQMVVIDVDGVNQGTEDLALEIGIVAVSVAEAVEPTGHRLRLDNKGRLHLGPVHLIPDGGALGFGILQHFFGGFRDDSHSNGVSDIFYFTLHFFQLGI